MFEGKKVLVVGMARSGISSCKHLMKDGAMVTASDSKSEVELKEVVSDLKSIGSLDFILGKNPSIDEVKKFDLAVLSPGIPLDLDYIVEMKKNDIEVISEIELAYRAGVKKGVKFVGITGTNGKTTTTSMMGEISKAGGFETYVVGNIGNPAIDAVKIASEGAILVTELSSFQLESVVDFKPEVCAVLNLTEDHMNRHHTIENYAKAKANIFKNQDKFTTCVLNYDDKIVRNMSKENNSNIVFFSSTTNLRYGVYEEGGYIFFAVENGVERLMKTTELSLPGRHNLENSMAAIAMALALDIDKKIICDVLKSFKAVEHRLEYVDTVDGVMYVNDSKGTNPDSTIKAITSYENPIVLIAGGYDKGSEFDELFDIAKDNVHTVVTMGQTAEIIEKYARKYRIDTRRVSDMKEAVKVSKEISKDGDVVLLSPACASWGMYNNYEERGRDFKSCVKKIKSGR